MPVEWVADVDRPAAHSAPVMRGETAALRASLVRRGSPFDPAAQGATIFWQTNGMGDTWWSAPAAIASNVLTAKFTPAMDPGAPLVTAFLAATSPSGNVYRAFTSLRFLHAPGATPNALPLPVPSLDFATVATTNAPWTLPEDVAAAIADALADYTPGGGGIEAETDPVFGAWMDGQTSVDHAETASALAGQVQGSRSHYYRVSDAGYIYQTGVGIHQSGYTNDWPVAGGRLATVPELTAAARDGTNYTDSAIAAIPAPDLSGYATHAYVTNYYGLSALGRIYISSNGYLYVESRDAATNAWETAWSSYAMQTNAAAVAARQDAVERTVEGAVSAWADYDAHGNANPDGDIIMLNRAYTAIGSGFFWASSGGHYCLCAEGSVAYMADTGGSFRIWGQSISNYVGLVAGGTITVGAIATGFRVTGDGANDVASIQYPYSTGGHPTIWGAATLAGPWTEMTSPVWVDDTNAGTSTASFPATENTFFFKATTTQQLSEYFHATVPAYLEGGVKVGADDASPVIYDATITIQSGGHTYRIPAELVQ